MEKIVDEMIECNYDDLEEVVIPFNKRIGLIVFRDSVKYEFLINLKEYSDKLLVVGSAAITRDSNLDRNKPVFHRWSWNFEESTIFYNDPTLYLSNELLGGWGLGSMDNWYLKRISDILNILIKKCGYENQNVIFYGSSLGGTMSIMLATLIKNSVAIAEVPQFDITNWGMHWEKLRIYLFDGLPTDYIKIHYKYKIDVIELMKIEQYIPDVYLILDCSHDYDFENVYLPFFKRLNELPFKDSENHIKIRIDGKNKGHSALPPEELLKIIKIVSLSMDNKN